MKTGRTYLSTFRLRWKTVLVAALLGELAGVLATSLINPTYSSSSTVLVSSRPIDGDAVSAYQASLLSAQKVKSYAGLITSDQVLEDVTASLGRSGVDVNVIRNKLDSTVKTDTTLITVTAVDSSADGARQIAEYASDSLVRVIADLERPYNDLGVHPLEARVVDAAQTPAAPVTPNLVTNILLGLTVGLLLGGIAAIARSAADTTMRSTEDLEATVDAPVLGCTVADGNVADRPLALVDNPDSGFAESVRNARNTLLLLNDEQRRALTVTSALPQEGKTLFASNLALALAKSGRQVLLIDGNLRNSKLSELFGLSDAPGLSDVLTGKNAFDNVVRPWSVYLDILPSGSAPVESSDIVAAPTMAPLLRRLLQTYEFLIIDTPALSEGSDAAVLTAKSDGSIVVVRHARTSVKDLQRALPMLRGLSGTVMGTVLSMVPLARRPAQTGRRSVAERTSSRQRSLGGHTLTAASVDGAATAKDRTVQRDPTDVHADPDRQQPAVAEHTPDLNNPDELTTYDLNEEVAVPPDGPLNNG
jgi:tyrosine-protein kinase